MHGNEELRRIPRRVILDTLSLEPEVRLKETEDNVAFDCFLFYLSCQLRTEQAESLTPHLYKIIVFYKLTLHFHRKV